MVAPRRLIEVVAVSVLAIHLTPASSSGQSIAGTKALNPPTPPSDLDATQAAWRLDVGSVVTGSLSDDDAAMPQYSYYDLWQLTGRRGTTVTVDLLSDAFDALLYMVGPFELVWDDDGGGACNARLDVTFPSDGTYTLYATSYTRQAVGPYTIRVSNRPPPPFENTCDTISPDSGLAQIDPPAPASVSCSSLVWMGWLAFATESGGGADYPAIEARARVACSTGIEIESGERWPNGLTLRLGDSWSYPNGRTARLGNTWSYPNGQTARLGNAFAYPDGRSARLGGSWSLPGGQPSSEEGVLAFALQRLSPERGAELETLYRSAPDEDWRTLYLIVMASEAARN